MGDLKSEMDMYGVLIKAIVHYVEVTNPKFVALGHLSMTPAMHEVINAATRYAHHSEYAEQMDMITKLRISEDVRQVYITDIVESIFDGAEILRREMNNNGNKGNTN